MRTLVLISSLLFLPLVAAAQDYHSWEFFGGYQFTRVDNHNRQDEVNLVTTIADIPHIDVGNHLNANGWNMSLQENKTSWFGGILDFSGAYAPKDVNLAPLFSSLGLPIPPGNSAIIRFNSAFYTAAGGPQFTYRRNRAFQPFARIMLGAAHAHLTTNALVNNVPLFVDNVPETDTNFALISGGGFDYRFRDNLAVRTTGDYVRTYLFSQTQNNFRMAVGLVFSWDFR